VVPTTISRAEEIADRIEGLFNEQDYVVPGTIFIRLSSIGASTRLEVLHALFIVVAHTFQSASRRSVAPDTRRKFDEFATAMGVLSYRLAISVVPDSELGMILRLHTSDMRVGIQDKNMLTDERLKRELAFGEEVLRLQALLKSDEAYQSETMRSFVTFLKTLDPAGQDYWPIVYRRMGLACPLAEVPDKPMAQTQPQKPWWQRLFG
jgi:hypothetical protein